MRRISATAIVVALGAVLVWAVPSGASLGHGSNKPGKNLWSHVTGKVPATHDGAKLDVRPDKQRAFTLDQNGLGSLLGAGAGARSAVVSLPDPSGSFQRFALETSDLMAPGPRGEASRDQDLHGPRHRRPGGDDPRRPEPARLPRVGPLAERRLVHRPVLPPRPEPLRELLRARPEGRRAGPFVERDADSGRALGRPRLLPRRRHRHRPRQRVRRRRGGHDHDLRSRGALRVAHADRARADGLGAFDDELRRRSGRQPRHAHRRGERRRRARPRRATRSCATTTRRATRRPATSSGRTGSR